MFTTARRAVTIGLLAAAVTGLGAGIATAQTAPTAPAPAAAATVAAAHSQAKGSTGITMVITNTTNQIMTLTGATNSYGHWQQRPTDIAAQTSITVSNYSDSGEGSNIQLTYQMPNGAQINLGVATPIAGDNNSTASVYGGGYTATGTNATGWHPTDKFVITAA